MGLWILDSVKAAQGAWASVAPVYFEVDFPEMVHRKSRVIAQREDLCALFGATRETLPACRAHGVDVIDAPSFKCVPADLRETPALAAAMRERGLCDVPTLFVCECVLVYMKPEQSDAVLEWAAQAVSSSAIVTYEHIHPDDPFGQVMMTNLASRGVPLLSLPQYPTLPAQEERYKRGWDRAAARTMKAVYDGIDEDERKRVNKLEWLDEVEEWNLFLD